MVLTYNVIYWISLIYNRYALPMSCQIFLFGLINAALERNLKVWLNFIVYLYLLSFCAYLTSCLHLIWLSFFCVFSVRLYMKEGFINWSCFVIKTTQKSPQQFGFIHESIWLVLTMKLAWYQLQFPHAFIC